MITLRVLALKYITRDEQSTSLNLFEIQTKKYILIEYLKYKIQNTYYKYFSEIWNTYEKTYYDFIRIIIYIVTNIIGKDKK